jgi:hypothetical protein
MRTVAGSSVPVSGQDLPPVAQSNLSHILQLGGALASQKLNLSQVSPSADVSSGMCLHVQESAHNVQLHKERIQQRIAEGVMLLKRTEERREVEGSTPDSNQCTRL